MDFLPALITHDDQVIREHALMLAAYGRNLPALKVYVASPFSQAHNGKDKSEIEYEYWRHIALLESCAYSPDASLASRMNPDHIALIAKHRPTDNKVLSEFNKYLQSEFEAIYTENPWSSSRYLCSTHKEAISTLVDYDLDALLQWLVPWVTKLGY